MFSLRGECQLWEFSEWTEETPRLEGTDCCLNKLSLGKHLDNHRIIKRLKLEGTLKTI